MLQGVELLVVDLVDVGTRYYTYMSTLHQTLIAGAEHDIPVLAIDGHEVARHRVTEEALVSALRVAGIL